jgi:hypothetical protein
MLSHVNSGPGGPGHRKRKGISMRRSGFLGILFLVLVAVVAGFVGYQAGLTSSAAAAGATVVVTGGFPGIGLLVFLLFFGFLFFAFAGRRRGHWGPGYGHGSWAGGMGSGGPGGPGDPSDPRRQWIAEVHRSLHADDAAAGRLAGDPPAG